MNLLPAVYVGRCVGARQLSPGHGLRGSGHVMGIRAFSPQSPRGGWLAAAGGAAPPGGCIRAGPRCSGRGIWCHKPPAWAIGGREMQVAKA